MMTMHKALSFSRTAWWRLQAYARVHAEDREGCRIQYVVHGDRAASGAVSPIISGSDPKKKAAVSRQSIWNY